MKWLLTLALLSIPFGASAQEDDELAHALRNLNGRGLYVDQSTRAVVRDRSRQLMMISAAVGMGLMAINSSFFRRGPNKAVEEIMVEAAWVGAAVGGLGYLGSGYAKKWVAAPTPLPASSYVNSPEAMNQFFALNLDQQLTAARQDETLRKFLINLSRAYEYTDRRTPDDIGWTTPE